MRGDEAVERFSERGNARYVPVKPERPCAIRPGSKEAKHRFGAGIVRAALKELDGLSELRDGNIRKTAGIGLVRLGNL